MGRIPVGSVVFVRFPFSDLSQSKRRPAIVLADAGLGDLVLCQITSNAFSDLAAVEIDPDDFHVGNLRKRSYARPGERFMAHSSLVGDLELDKFDEIREAVIALLQASKQP